MLELDGLQEFDAARDADFFAALPAQPGVLLIEMADPQAQPYLARTADIRRAAERLLRIQEAPAKRLNLRAVAARVRYRSAGSKFEQILAHYQQARARFPRRYRDVVRVRPPAMLKVNLRNAYPRCYVTRRIRADDGFYFGPFPSRKSAEAFGEGFLDLFKIRRCQIKIRPDPAFPGCIYSEMKMCLAPCFAGCTKQEYDVEVGRVLEALETTGASLTLEVERERETASAALDFERASALHKRLDKISAALRGLPALTRRVEDLNAVILQRAAEEKTIAAFPIRAGVLAEPIFLRFGELSSEPRSVEAILRAGLDSAEGSQTPAETAGASLPAAAEIIAPPSNAPSGTGSGADSGMDSEDKRREFGLRAAPADLGEHLSLIARWFYSNPREGEIFFREADWPYRRILRACARLLAAPANSGVPGAAPAKESLKVSRDRIRRLNAFSRRHRPSSK